MTAYAQCLEALRAKPRKWLVTGCAGFIGSHIVETLLGLGQRVVGLDNFATGSQANVNDVLDKVGSEAWGRFNLVEGDVRNLLTCHAACAGVDAVLHQAGFVSVPLSMKTPLICHATNVTGTLNLLLAARDAGVGSFVYASSSAVYGDEATMPQREDRIGQPLSPYGASKLMDELYANIFASQFGLRAVGLRYFNVFGPRQSPSGGYAAVIPAWITTLVAGGECAVHGDGKQTRDFCHVANVVQANILAATAENPAAKGAAYNVALGGSTTLLELYKLIAERVGTTLPPRLGEPRAGDIVHSAADIGKITRELGFAPLVDVPSGLDETVAWYRTGA